MGEVNPVEFVQGSLYFISDRFFEVVNDPNLMVNYQTTKRPHYYAVRDPDTSLLWMIPRSSRVEKYRRIINERKRRHKTTKGIHLVRIQGMEMALLLQNMFPVRECFIDSRYFRGGQPVMIANPKTIQAIEKDVKQVIMMFRHHVKFFPGQPDALRIERIMLED